MLTDDEERGKFQNELINHRLTWLGVWEGLLFVAYYNQPASHPYLLPVVGLLIALSIDRGVAGANRALPPEQKAKPEWAMPGVVIPKVVALAWVVLLGETLMSRCFG
jgi:hypothetical protein